MNTFKVTYQVVGDDNRWVIKHVLIKAVHALAAKAEFNRQPLAPLIISIEPFGVKDD